MESERLVFVGVPHNGEMCTHSFRGIAGSSQKGVPFLFEEAQSSLLQRNFNELLVKCRQHQPRPSHFALHHADIIAPPGWLDTLLSEMYRVDADVISVVSPLKDHRGLTSTGVFSDDLKRLRRLTMTEVVDQLPVTFSAEDVCSPLAVNTALFLCRTDRDWFSEMVFRMEDEIITNDDGTLEAFCRSEDWLWSEWMHRRGIRVFATRAVQIAHVGPAPFSNFHAWGTEKEEGFKLWRR